MTELLKIDNIPRSTPGREIKNILNKICASKYYHWVSSTSIVFDLGYNAHMIDQALRYLDGYKLGDNILLASIEKEAMSKEAVAEEKGEIYHIFVDENVTAKHLISVQKILADKRHKTTYLADEEIEISHCGFNEEYVILLTKELETCGDLVAVEGNYFNKKHLEPFSLKAFENLVHNARPAGTKSILKRKAIRDEINYKLKKSHIKSGHKDDKLAWFSAFQAATQIVAKEQKELSDYIESGEEEEEINQSSKIGVW